MILMVKVKGQWTSNNQKIYNLIFKFLKAMSNTIHKSRYDAIYRGFCQLDGSLFYRTKPLFHIDLPRN